MLVGNPKYEVTQGSITFNGKDLLALSPEDRSHEGIFMSFQSPIEIPGVSMTNFLRAAVNARRKYQGLDPMPAPDFLKLLREKRKLVGLDAHFMSRGVNEGFSGGERKRNEIFQMAVLEPLFSILDETDSGLDVDALRIVAEGFNTLRGERTSAYNAFIANCFETCPRQALHARTLGFEHPRTHEQMFFEAPIPEDMLRLIEKWRNYIHNTVKN